MSPLAKYGTIALLSILLMIVGWEISKVIRPAPDAGTQDFINEVCKIDPNDKRCKK